MESSLLLYGLIKLCDGKWLHIPNKINLTLLNVPLSLTIFNCHEKRKYAPNKKCNLFFIIIIIIIFFFFSPDHWNGILTTALLETIRYRIEHSTTKSYKRDFPPIFSALNLNLPTSTNLNGLLQKVQRHVAKSKRTHTTVDLLQKVPEFAKLLTFLILCMRCTSIMVWFAVVWNSQNDVWNHVNNYNVL